MERFRSKSIKDRRIWILFIQMGHSWLDKPKPLLMSKGWDGTFSPGPQVNDWILVSSFAFITPSKYQSLASCSPYLARLALAREYRDWVIEYGNIWFEIHLGMAMSNKIINLQWAKPMKQIR